MSPSTKRILARQQIGYWVKQMIRHSRINGIACTFEVRETAPLKNVVRRHDTVNSTAFHGAEPRTLRLFIHHYDYRTLLCRVDYRPENYDRKVVDVLSPDRPVLHFKTYPELDFAFINRVVRASLEWHPLVMVESK